MYGLACPVITFSESMNNSWRLAIPDWESNIDCIVFLKSINLPTNRNVLSNRALILDEVRNHLAYNGIKTANGVSYYDFTYNGSCSATYRNVPQTVINYLLYELAFYRAGFGWGYYYDHACDGMHFTLSEMSASIHDTSGRSLRKVYQYIG